MKILFIAILILSPFFASAINPERTYRYSPEQYNLESVTLKIDTPDGASLSVWRIPAQKKHKANVVVVCSDAGNMAYWLSLAYYLNYLDYDVWMFDYRGFGESSDFEVKREMLFYNEYVIDLESVLRTVESESRKPVFLIGYSMGTIIINEYLNSHTDRRIRAVVYDGFVGNPYSFSERMRGQGKQIELPPCYEYRGVFSNVPILCINSLQDKACSKDDFPGNAKSVDFDCGHIMALYSFRDEYISELESFFGEH